jgi:exopolyphosphatase/guanosine-5'-triphosphate,3'-diphosphate pyrophosphatase
MRIGIVDLGTMSLRLDVYETQQNGRPKLLARHRSMPRLGSLLFHEHAELPVVRQTLRREFADVRDFCRRYQTEHIIAVATSALRESGHAEELCQQVLRESRISIKILSGEEEARLTALGIFANETVIPANTALVDIGGGSTEISFCRDTEISSACSLPIGALRLEQRFLQSRRNAQGVFSPSVLQEMRAYISSVVNGIHADARKFQPTAIIGSSGTLRTLENLGLCGNSRPPIIRKETLDAFIAKISPLTREELLSVPGMEEARVDVILPGALLLQQIMETLGVEIAQVSHFALRHGVLEERLRTAG